MGPGGPSSIMGGGRQGYPPMPPYPYGGYGPQQGPPFFQGQPPVFAMAMPGVPQAPPPPAGVPPQAPAQAPGVAAGPAAAPQALPPGQAPQHGGPGGAGGAGGAPYRYKYRNPNPPLLGEDVDTWDSWLEAFKIVVKEACFDTGTGSVGHTIIEDDLKRSLAGMATWHHGNALLLYTDQENFWGLLFASTRHCKSVHHILLHWTQDKNDPEYATKCFKAIVALFDPDNNSARRERREKLRAAVKSFRGEWTKYMTVVLYKHAVTKKLGKGYDETELISDIVRAILDHFTMNGLTDISAGFWKDMVSRFRQLPEAGQTLVELQNQGLITQGLVDEVNASKGQTPSTHATTGQYTGGQQAAQQVAAYDRAFEAPGRLDMPIMMTATGGYMPGSQPAYNQMMYPAAQLPTYEATVQQAQAEYMSRQYMADLRARFPEQEERAYKTTPTTSKEVEEVLAKVNKPSKFIRQRRTETKARILPPVSPSAVVCGKCGALLDLGSQPKGRYMVCGACNSPLHETETCRIDAVRKRVRELGRDHTERHEEEEPEDEEVEELEEQEEETKTTRWSPRRIPSPNSFRPWNRGGNRNFSNSRPPWEKKRSPTPDEEFPGVKPKKVKFQGPQRDAGWERKSNPRSRSNSRERDEDTRRNNVQARENRRFKSNPWRSNQPAMTPEPWRNSKKEDPIKQVARAVQMAKVMVDEQTMMQRVAALATSTTPQRQPDLAGLQQVLQQVAQPHFNISSGHNSWPKTGMMAFGYGYKPQEDAEENEDGKEDGASQIEGPPQAAVAVSTATRGHTVTIEEVSDDEPEQVEDSPEEGVLSWQEEPEHDQPRRRRESARRQLEAVAHTTRTA